MGQIAEPKEQKSETVQKVKLFDRLFTVTATFADSDVGTKQANEWMVSNQDQGVLIVEDGTVYLAALADKGEPYANH